MNLIKDEDDILIFVYLFSKSSFSILERGSKECYFLSI